MPNVNKIRRASNLRRRIRHINGEGGWRELNTERDLVRVTHWGQVKTLVFCFFETLITSKSRMKDQKYDCQLEVPINFLYLLNDNSILFIFNTLIQVRRKKINI